jgi:hypothetical protein
LKNQQKRTKTVEKDFVGRQKEEPDFSNNAKKVTVKQK